MTTTDKKTFGLSSFALRHIAMLTMLVDHTGSSLFPEQLWLRYIGRLAFPIFAFLLVEGFYHTKNLRHYALRLLGMALITDIPFQYLLNGNLDYLPFQNVLWTFLIALATMTIVDWIRKHSAVWVWIPSGLLITLATSYLAYSLNTDYDLLGVMTVMAFYFFRGKGPAKMVSLFIIMLLIHLPIATLHSIFKQVPEFDLSQLGLYYDFYGLNLISPQYYAIFSLPLIWAYNGKAGHKSKVSQIFSYLFYPLHMLILGWLQSN